MDNIIENLNKLSQQIEVAKKQKSSLEGRQEEILHQLKGKYKINTIEEAEQMLMDYDEQIKSLEEEITVKFNTLKKQHSW